MFNFREYYLYGRELTCYFNFGQNEDVTEMTHNLFKNFNATNNQFDFASFYFSNDGETSNFMFDYATSGHLEVKFFAVQGISVENGKLPMTESAVLGSINSLEALWIENNDYSQNLAFSENFLFAMELLELKFLCLFGFDWDKFQLPEQTVLMLETFVVDMKFETLPEMQNLKHLYLIPTEEASLSSEVLRKVSNLEFLVILEVEDLGGKLKAVLPGTFEKSAFLKSIYLSETNVASIDLTGLGPSTFVDLSYSSITNLSEQNFRPFLEGAVQNFVSFAGGFYFSFEGLVEKLIGGINLANNALDCTCDLKWLCEIPFTSNLTYNAECADGTTLETYMEFIWNQCP